MAYKGEVKCDFACVSCVCMSIDGGQTDREGGGVKMHVLFRPPP